MSSNRFIRILITPIFLALCFEQDTSGLLVALPGLHVEGFTLVRFLAFVIALLERVAVVDPLLEDVLAEVFAGVLAAPFGFARERSSCQMEFLK